MFKEIHLAGSVRTPFGSFCGALADVSAVELGKVAAERRGVRSEDVKETPRGKSSAAPSARTPQARSGSAQGPGGGGMGIAMALKLT
jgi:acetyl-CoA acetyltransferase